MSPVRARPEEAARGEGPGRVPPAGLLDFIMDGANGRFLVASHINPEGDALGSTLALVAALRALGKEAIAYNRDGTPEQFRFLPGWEGIRNVLPGRPGDFTLVLVDCQTHARAALEGAGFLKTLVVDHHEPDIRKPGETAADIIWIEPSSPAAGLMVYDLIKALGVEIDRWMAENLYTAIATDTGSFRYANTTAGALDAAAALVRAGARPDEISRNVYETWTEKKMRLLCLVLQTLELRDGAAIMSVEAGMFKATGTGVEDTDNFTSFPRLLKDAQVAALLSEIEGGLIRGSLRSKGGVDVRLIARKFGGGGHINAAGFRTSAGENGLAGIREELFKAIAETSRKEG